MDQMQPRIDFVDAVWKRVRKGNQQRPLKA
jgi:hypothetical protein